MNGVTMKIVCVFCVVIIVFCYWPLICEASNLINGELIIIIIVIYNISLPLWKLSVYMCRIEVSETLDCLTLTINIESFLPLIALRQ